MAKVLFKGFKQSNMSEYLAAVQAGEAKQYMWLVRSDAAASGDTQNEGEIYFGTRHYGHVSASESATLSKALESVGLDEHGNYVPYTEGNYTAEAQTVLEATSALDDKLKEVYDEVVRNKPIAGDSISLSVANSGTTINVTVQANDPVLASNPDGLSATLQLKKLESGDTGYDASFASQYKLVGKDGSTALGTTIDLIKDQFLKKVEYVSEMTQEKIDEFHLPGTVTGYTDNPYLCFLWELDTDPSEAGDQVGTAIPLSEIFNDFNLVFRFNGEEFTKQADGSYSITVTADEINTLAAINVDSTVEVGTAIPAGTSVEDALKAVYSGAVLWIDGNDAE